ncbi:membrane protein insertase YidC [Hoyosella rhizosphaerae]|uniref:Membrane protein insertase YidC n=1 Tax=Hoyosella rhizosphaerae TaxID=1755582 RepID=A0A916U9J8_9ACTN|nr:membrane protein insertase YidC [Hoyosella rhizosphaerae]MBN4927483.1 membrane protein insertase YidC [Hoyosella rhizosphaerae]GGC64126.1 membrane protein insertase YidC [Hoyosella rhizosphaerae]
MLNFIYYPVSGILWFWHKVFGYLPFLGPDHGVTWALSVIFLVFTIRALLYKPFVKQVRTTRKMQELQPQIKALRKKYSKDRQRMAMEMQKLQREHGFNPLLGCLPIFAQIPVFIGLYHVLMSFNRTGGIGPGRLNMTPEQNVREPNYVFSVDDVQSFLDARLFGSPLSAAIAHSEDLYLAFGVPELVNGIPSRTAVAFVAIPLMIVASIATHLNARHSISRQTAEVAEQPQTAIMNRLALYIFPFGVLVGGPFLPVAVLLYWVANNAWTLGQQKIVYNQIDREEEAKRQEAIERRDSYAPRPGAKPSAVKRGDSADASVEGEADDDTADASPSPTAARSTPQVGMRPNNPRPRNPKAKKRKKRRR